jgi:small subunit ribosomal protein S1
VKQLTPDPWGAVPSTYPVGSRHSAKVLRLAEFGAFVELEPNVEGLVHVSEMRWGKSVHKPSDVVQKGQTVDVQVLDIDTTERRIALGMRQLTPNPYETLRAKYPRGARLSGTVRSVTEFGVFVALETGVDGLVHASDMAWSERIRPADRYKVGDTLDVVMLDVNVDGERVALGVKQLTEDPWMLAVGAKPVGTKFTGAITSVTDFGAFVEVAPGIQGLCHVSELTLERGARPSDLVKVGDQLTVVVQHIDEDSHRIELSALAAEREDNKVPEQPAFVNSSMAEKLSKMKLN